MLTRGATPSRVMGWCARFARTAALSTSTLPRLYWVPPRSAHGSGPSRYITRVLSWRQLWCPSACGRGSSGGGVLPVVVAAATGATVAMGPGGSVEAAASLISASRAGNDRLVRQLLRQGADPNDTEGQLWGNTPLKEAANYGHLEVVELLIAAGADLNKADRAGETPLMVTNISSLPNSCYCFSHHLWSMLHAW